MKPRRPRVFFTCFGCGQVTQEFDILDDRKYCQKCLHELLYGRLIDECKKRGYHKTNGSIMIFGGLVRVNCKCQQEAVCRLYWGSHRLDRLSPVTPGWSRITDSRDIPKYWKIDSDGYAEPVEVKQS